MINLFQRNELSECFFFSYSEQIAESMGCRARRRIARGSNRQPQDFIEKLRQAKRNAPENEKPQMVKTRFRNLIIMPEMVGSIIGLYNGQTFNPIEIMPEMIGHCLSEFTLNYKFVKHGKPAIGCTRSKKFYNS